MKEKKLYEIQDGEFIKYEEPSIKYTVEKLWANCPVCGSDLLMDYKCKQICNNCKTILKTCSDL